MVLYYDPHFNMFPSRHNSHPAVQSPFAYSQGFYATASLQSANQNPSAAHYATSQTTDMACSPTVGLNGTVNSDPSVLQQAAHWHPHSVYQVSAPGLPSAAAVHASACARAAAAAVAAYEDWGQQQGPSLSGSPCSQVPTNSQSPVALTSSSGGALYTYGQALQAYRGAVSSPPTIEFSPAHLTDATTTGHPSPDSGLTISSDGMGEEEAPQTMPTCRPQPVRSPFEWMKKPSYQSQPNPEDLLPCRYNNDEIDADPPNRKTRTKDKYRVVYSDHQRLELEKEFHYSRYITIRRKSELAAMLGLSERQVKIWFQNRRAKERKQTKKREEMLQKEKDTIHHLHTAAALNMMVTGKTTQSVLSLD